MNIVLQVAKVSGKQKLIFRVAGRSCCARPEDLACEVVHLLGPDTRITGDIRNVDGGYHLRG